MICITGTRADYGIYQPLLYELHEDEQFDLKLVVTGMHLVKEYGKTIDEVRNDPFEIIAAPSILFKGDSTYAMSQSLGMGILYFSDIFHYFSPQFILLLGDRGEMLAAAIAAHYQNIGIIHLHGGEISGSADDSIRHAISKLSHLHFVSTLKSKQHLLQLGEEDWRIIPIGSLRQKEIKRIIHLSPSVKQELAEKYSLQSHAKNVLILIHPDSKENRSFPEQINPVLAAIDQLNDILLILIGPNSDAGGDLFREKMLEFASKKKNACYFSSIPSEDYLYLLSQANLLIGNSSSGIIEAPFFHLPVINIGNRQKFREQADQIINTDYTSEEILKHANQLLNVPRKFNSYNPYDIGVSPEKTMTAKLKSLASHPNLLQKYFVEKKAPE